MTGLRILDESLPLPKPHNPSVCAVIPVYNHGGTLRAVAEKTLRQLPDVLVVDDGSTDCDPAEQLRGLPVLLLRQKTNCGKGAALLRALALLRRMRFRYMLTLDADGQHDPTDIPAFLKWTERGQVFVIGCRDFSGQPVPFGSKLGRALSNGLFRLESGIGSQDCQSGFRMYPVQLISELHFRCSRYDFEAEVLARAAWAGAEFHDVPIRVFYPEPGQRITHFRKLPELTRLTLLHLRLLVSRLFHFPRFTVRGNGE